MGYLTNKGFVPVKSEVVWWWTYRLDEKGKLERAFKRFGMVLSVSTDKQTALVEYYNFRKESEPKHTEELKCDRLFAL
jgi:hypothetical protein